MVKKTSSATKKRKGMTKTGKVAKTLGAAGVTIAGLAALYKLYKTIQQNKANRASNQPLDSTKPLQMQSMTDIATSPIKVGGTHRPYHRSGSHTGTKKGMKKRK